MSNPTLLAKRVIAKQRGPSSGWKIEPDLKETGFKKVEERIKELELNTDPSKQVNIVGMAKSGEVGTDQARDSSIGRYEIIWNTTRDFCFYIGDYDSAIILARAQCPANPLPVSLDTAVHCMRFLTMNEGTPLLHHKTNQPVKDMKGRNITCVGIWRSPNTVDLYRTALAKVHKHYQSTSTLYQGACDDCVALGFEKCRKGEGCRRHLGKPEFWSVGNVTKSEEFKTKHKQMLDYARAQYQVRNTVAFLPSELRAIRLYLLSHNSLYHLMIWTIMIVGIKLFARVEEALELTMEQLDSEYFSVTSTDVESLCCMLNGKCDNDWVHLAMWDDKDCPEFSASRALLIWLALSGIKSGRIFPTTSQIGSASPTESFQYGTFLHIIKGLVSDVLKKDIDSPKMQKIIIGTHMLRKTAYLLACWGWRSRSMKIDELDVANVSMSARHADMKIMMSYLSDSGTLQELLKRVAPDDSEQKVGVWQPIHIKTHENFQAINFRNKQFIKPAAELADWYAL